MSLTSLTPKEAAEKMKHKAVLIDIRHTDEYLRKHITSAISLPLNTLAKNTAQLPQNGVVIFGCLSGMRTQQNANLLENYSKNCQEAYILQGGLMAWEKAGLPIEAQPNAPWGFGFVGGNFRNYHLPLVFRHLRFCGHRANAGWLNRILWLGKSFNAYALECH